jgi:multidrug efflux pump subunit AcrA (membrane-fusion protein)
MKKFLKWGGFFIFVIILGFVFYKKVYIPKHTYKIITPIKGDLKVKVYGIGNISAKTIYKVNSEVSGRILKLNSDIGKLVKKGELLAVIDSVDLPKKLEIEKLKLNLEKLNKDLEILKVKKWLANKTFQRNKKLLKSKGRHTRKVVSEC